MVVTGIKQVHLLNIRDSFVGLLIHVDGRLQNGAMAEWEAQVKPADKFKLLKPFGPISRLKIVQVSDETLSS